MIVEKKLEALGLSLPDTARDYAVNASGARFVSHLAVGNMLYVEPAVEGANEADGPLSSL